MEELKPCPFCGKKGALQIIEDEDTYCFTINCNASTADRLGGCGTTLGYSPTRRQAIEKWNTRFCVSTPEESKRFSLFERF